MKTLVRAICAVLILPLSVFADTLVISTSGRGATEVAAVAAAKRQAAADALSAGFFPQDGYRIGPTRVVEVTRSGAVYVAHIDSKLETVSEPSRVVFVVTGDDVQTARLLSLVQRMRVVLTEQRTGARPNIEVVDIQATGNLRLTSLADLQRPGLESELKQKAQTLRARVIYLLTESSEPGTTLLVAHRTDTNGVTIRTLRDGTGATISPLMMLVADAVWQDVAALAEYHDARTAVTLSTPNTVVRKGQTVIICADKTSDGAFCESTFVARGIVTEVSGSRVHVLTEKPVVTAPNVKLRQSPIPKRGIVINESDW